MFSYGLGAGGIDMFFARVGGCEYPCALHPAPHGCKVVVSQVHKPINYKIHVTQLLNKLSKWHRSIKSWMYSSFQ